MAAIGLATLGSAASGRPCALEAIRPIGPVPETPSLASALSGAGDIVIAGAPYAGPTGFESGGAVIFRIHNGGLIYDESLSPPGVSAGEHFGFAVATDGVRVAAGSPEDSGPAFACGSVRVFAEAGGAWLVEQTIFAPDAATGDRFGAAVAIEGDTLIVGAPARDADAEDTGSVYVFARIGSVWMHTQTLHPPDADAGDRFGVSLSTDGSRLVIGASADDERGADAGAAYIFEHIGSGWAHSAKLLAAAGAPADLLGWSVALSGDTAVAGAPGRDNAGSFAGAAFVFEHQGGAWVEQGTLVPAEGSEFDRAGSSVSVAHGVVIVGAPRDDTASINGGLAAVFTRDAGVWTQAATVRASDAAPEAGFGAATALAGTLGLFGAPKAGPGSGAVYLLPALGDCDGSGALDACEVDSGLLPDLDGDLRPDACNPPPCPGDATGNGVVDVRDLNLVLAFWNQQPYAPFLGVDLSGDGFVDIDDLNTVLSNWSCQR